MSAWSSRLIQVAAVCSNAGLRLTTMIAFRRLTAWNLINVLAEAAFAGIHDLFQLGDDRLGRAVGNRENSDGLSAHPVDVEAHARCRPRLRRSAPVPWISKRFRVESARTAAGLGRKAVHQFQEGLRRHILQRYHRDAVAGLRAGGRAASTRPAPTASPSGVRR